MNNKTGYIYLIKSKRDGSYYFGSTNDVNRRLFEHNSGKSVSTRCKRPWDLLELVKFSDTRTARKVEKLLKSQHEKVSHTWFKAKIAAYRAPDKQH